jgi:hypothetical protein
LIFILTISGRCAPGATCQVRNHSPICSCPPQYSGDPFYRCYKVERVEPPQETRNPCQPSPCGPFSECKEINGIAACSCLKGYIGSPPNCRPECTINEECPNDKACMQQRCQDPCPGSCGYNSNCRVTNHYAQCYCNPGFTGDPFSGCNEVRIEPTQPPVDILNPCTPSPCGSNARCAERNGAGACTCIDEYFGDPYAGCRPECTTNSECPSNKACVRNKCVDPCPGVCGLNSICDTVNHVPTCTCLPGYTGEPFSGCRLIPPPPPVAVQRRDPCQPSPCGSFSTCRTVNEQAICSCLPGYIGSPPSCRPECVVSSECPLEKACVNQKCINPCPEPCAQGANCQVINHSPICSCPPQYTGDPFYRCYKVEKIEQPPEYRNPCVPSPCGPFSECKEINGVAACSCQVGYIGSPPSCRPQCTINQDCRTDQACIQNKCRDPCDGTCGVNAECRTMNHNPQCHCLPGYEGNPFFECKLRAIPTQPPPQRDILDPCNPSPCGSNAECSNRGGVGSCKCIPDYFGDPYSGCRPECVNNNDCSRDKACISYHCKDPCPGVCGVNAECQVVNHIPTCTCLSGYTGEPFSACFPEPQKPERVEAPRDPCIPSPCGPYSKCDNRNGVAVCSCLPNYIGTPPNCRPECSINSDCPLDKACQQQRCKDPCPGACGQRNTNCKVINHSPICVCNDGYVGDPFAGCHLQPKVQPEAPSDPCQPSPCGRNAECRVIGSSAACSCLVGFIGRPPNCRPECVVNEDCPWDQACIERKCGNPCGNCRAANSECRVSNHVPRCTCLPGYTGTPEFGCYPIERTTPIPATERPPQPCEPSPCGINALCQVRNGAGSCSCRPGYFGDPYRECKVECEQNSDCDRSKACISYKCKDPCPGTCGINARCEVTNHIPICTCPEGYQGNAFIRCIPIPPEVVRQPTPSDPCNPNPCGPYSVCINRNGQASCSCQAGYIGSPPNCRPECIVSSECPLDKACSSQKCIDPCPGSCGRGAVCKVINHSPLCSCPPGNHVFHA